MEDNGTFIKYLDPQPNARLHWNYILVGFDIMGLFKKVDEQEFEKAIVFVPKRRLYRDRSKYSPHQGWQERARRLAHA